MNLHTQFKCIVLSRCFLRKKRISNVKCGKTISYEKVISAENPLLNIKAYCWHALAASRAHALIHEKAKQRKGK